MSENIFWLFELAIQPGKADAFEALMKEMVANTRTGEPHTVNYEWFVNADKTRCHIYERYRDSDAVMTHMQAFMTHYAERFFSCAKAERMRVYGRPSAAARAALEQAGAEFLEPWGGFSR